MLYVLFVRELTTMNLNASQNAPAGANNILMIANVNTDTVLAQQQSIQQHQDKTRGNHLMQTQSPSEYLRKYNQTVHIHFDSINTASSSTTSHISTNSVTLLHTDKQGKTYVLTNIDVQPLLCRNWDTLKVKADMGAEASILPIGIYAISPPPSTRWITSSYTPETCTHWAFMQQE